MSTQIRNKEDLKGVINEMMADLVREHPQLVLDAMANNPEAMKQTLRAAGFNVTAATGELDAGVVTAAHRRAVDEGVIVGGFGARVRSGLETRTVWSGVTGKRRRTFLFGEVEQLGNEWARALMDQRGINRETGRSVETIALEINKRTTRAPSTPMTADAANGGGANLVPTVIAAEIFEEMNERFVIQNRVQVFVSAAPLQIPKRIAQVTMSRGAGATDIPEKDYAATLGNIKLSPERVSALAYVEPQLALAAVVGPVRWVIGQIAEAMAKDLQRVILTGNTASREPQGIEGLPIAGGNAYDRAKTATYSDTNRSSRRDSFRKLFYAIAQAHRESSSFVWAGNNSVLQVLASLNDMDQRPFEDANGGASVKFMGKEFVETTAMSVTAGTPDTAGIICGDMCQYAYVESPDGLRIEQTTVGGQAWTSDTIGIKAVQWYDGAPIIPPAFGRMSGIVI